jgi:arylsulfatase A-like enzyme
MILRGPGFTGGDVRRELVSLIDLPPTILNAAAPPEDNRLCPQRNMRGRPLHELVSGGVQDWPEEVFLQISESQCGRAIRTAKWKYSVRAPQKTGSDPDSDVYEEDFLYDLESDPHERNNLIANPDYSGIRKDLARTLKRRMVEAGEAEPEIRESAKEVS